MSYYGETLISSQTIGTDAGAYTLEIHRDTNPSDPFGSRSIFSTGYLSEQQRFIGVTCIGEESAKDHGGPGVDTIEGAIDAGHSPRAILRWLRLAYGAAGFVELSRNHDGSVTVSDIDEATASTGHGLSGGYSDDAAPQLEGLACIFPADYAAAMGEGVNLAKARDIVRGEWNEYAAYSEGDVIGYRLLDPEGDEISACWGYYGEAASMHDIIGEARAQADADAGHRFALWLNAERTWAAEQLERVAQMRERDELHRKAGEGLWKYHTDGRPDHEQTEGLLDAVDAFAALAGLRYDVMPDGGVHIMPAGTPPVPAAASALVIEVIGHRDPDGDTDLTVFADGAKIDARIQIADPGRGWSAGEWEASRVEATRGLSPAAADALNEIYNGEEMN